MLNQKLTGQQAADKTYIEDVFSTYLYTGNGSTQTITNGIDLAGKGGMVWVKSRNNAYYNNVVDTVRGNTKYLYTNTTDVDQTSSTNVTSFNSNGFTATSGNFNISSSNYASWTFRKQPKFFDVVTYTGNGVAGRTVSHSLGQAPGMIIVKRTAPTDSNWLVYHRSIGATKYLELNTTVAAGTDTYWYNTAPTATNFTVGSYSDVNSNGSTYVAYLFAHDTSTDGLIQCGSFTTDASGNATVNIGWEPQYVLFKGASGSYATDDPWGIGDSMRGMTTTNIARLIPNLPNAEDNLTFYVPVPTATGFNASGFAGNTTYIYMAIRRGPMKTPTDGTKVFSPLAVNAATGTQQTTSFPVDMQWAAVRAGNANNTTTSTRLIGVNTDGATGSTYLVTSSTAAEATGASVSRTNTWWNTGFKVPSSYNSTSTSFWNFQRAPGFFDVVCWKSSTNSSKTLNHNLGVTPELVILKGRNVSDFWYTCHVPSNRIGYINGAAAFYADSSWPATSTTFTIGAGYGTSPYDYVTYLFASCPGVSKVGSYTGTGATQTINCGFTGGARFVLIKRTDSTGGWYVWDTARGMTTGTDPSLLMNSTAAEVNVNWVYTTTGGFQIVTTNGNVNASGGTYIYLAIA